MIELVAVSARGVLERGRPSGAIRAVTIACGAGTLAIVGGREDGTSTVLAVAAGAVAPRSGRASVHGRPPGASRARVAYVPLEPALPEALRVDEICELAADLRGEPRRPAAERLAPLGVESLARRAARSLSFGEARAVSLALALSSKADVLLLDEPLASLDPVAPSRVVAAVRARARGGASVVATTASVRDALALGDRLALMTRGALVPIPAAFARAGGAKVRVVVAGREAAGALVAALTSERAIEGVETAAYAGGEGVSVIAAGPDLGAVAQAITRAVARAAVDVEAVESDALALDALRAAALAPARAAGGAP